MLKEKPKSDRPGSGSSTSSNESHDGKAKRVQKSQACNIL